MLTTLARLTGYIAYLQNSFGFFGASKFVYFYVVARMRGDKPGRLHYISVGPYSFYFPSAVYFAGLFNEIFFKEEYYLDKTNAPMQAFDCGANIGVALLYMKLRAPNAVVTCFEPNPAARNVLEKNIQVNGWQKSVTVVASALGATSGKAEFYVGPEADTDSSGSLVPRSDGADFNSYKVTVEPLSNYLTGPVDFLKLDIEGPEFEVLEEVAASKKLSLISYIQMEYHLDPGSNARPLSSMLTFLESQGFETAIQSPTHPHLMKKGWRKNCLVYAWRKFAQ
jgi:FkbM family methyltransferase